jgi:hypothetical protein
MCIGASTDLLLFTVFNTAESNQSKFIAGSNTRCIDFDGKSENFNPTTSVKEII